jgi:hypothetical protein
MGSVNEFPPAIRTMKEGEEVAMRIRKAFLSTAVLATVGLLGATGAMAQAPPPPPSSCSAGAYTVTVTSGPTVVPCGESFSSDKQCTEIEYTVSGTYTDFTSTDHVGALEGLGVAYVRTDAGVCSMSPCKIFPAGQGDNLTGLGIFAPHEQAVRVDPNDIKSSSFTIGLSGVRAASPTSVLVKKGKAINSCRILGIGLEAVDNPLATVTAETHEVLGGKCHVKVTKDQSGIHVVADPDVLSNGCSSLDVKGPFPPGSVNFTINAANGTATDAGPLEFSEGLNFIVGSGSCTWKQYYPPTGGIYQICY